MSVPYRTLAILFIALPAAVGCVSGGVEVLPAGHVVIVNGEAVPVNGASDLLALLRRRATATRLGENAPPSEAPLVRVDGVTMVDGPRVLARIFVGEVERVSILRSTEAMPRYGPAAAHGAILVTTRRGSG